MPSLPIAGQAPAHAPIDPSLDLEDEIRKLKKSRNAVLLAHYYQEGDIQDVADVIGDSLQLAQAAANSSREIADGSSGEGSSSKAMRSTVASS